MIDEHQIRLSFILDSLKKDYSTDLTDWVNKQLVEDRIRCDALGYSLSEARFPTIGDWEFTSNFDYEEELRNRLADAT